jgi:hypothetical protein
MNQKQHSDKRLPIPLPGLPGFDGSDALIEARLMRAYDYVLSMPSRAERQRRRQQQTADK